jgi:cardiolipin synthase A/B
MALHVLLTIVIALRVIMRRPATGVALAWILFVVALPFIGAAIYMIIGERRLSPRRAKRLLMQHEDFHRLCDAMIADGLTAVDWSRHPAAAQGLDRLGRRTTGSPALSGSGAALFSETTEIFRRLVADIDAAKASVLMEFYIWHPGGAADEVLDAVIRAAGRGVVCRLLIDALGSGPWWRGRQPRQLRDAGVELRAALPASLLRTVVGRTDLRLHRKIVVIDGRVAWTGSMNLVDPRYFKQEAGVGQWVDAMARIEGAAVAPLAAIATGDWMVETDEPLHDLLDDIDLAHPLPAGSADIQVIPSGPGESGNALLQMLLAAINAAQEELVITTPYLVPDDALLWALRGAAGRGVRVSIILPEKVDSILTRYASRSYYQDLLGAGIDLFLYRGGLLHTKSLTVDGAMAMFGTVNFDMRSLWLNYEVALFLYDTDFTAALRALQRAYLADADTLDPAAWTARAGHHRFIENALRLVGPLL